MAIFPNLRGLVRSTSLQKGSNDGRGTEAADSLAKAARKNESMLCSTGKARSHKYSRFASVCSKRGEKGTNQDCFVVWEDFGCQDDMIFCGVFDGHGPWGHLVAKRARELVPSSLLCNWQEAVGLELATGLPSGKLDDDGNMLELWSRSFLKTYAQVDYELKQDRSINCYQSGCTALTIVKQGDRLLIANIGDCRAVLARVSEDGTLAPIQLTVDLKPNLPREAERIKQSRGRVFCMNDEPGLYRMWTPNGNSNGLAVSRAFGDYCIKDFGLISVPDISPRKLSPDQDRFVILATDGVWDVVSNQEAVDIVSSVPDREQSAKRLVEHAASAWKRRRRGIAKDDITAICLFLNPPANATTPPHPSRRLLKEALGDGHQAVDTKLCKK
ncbi:hypothetical protein MLD38_019636 [Melastoma candidum]|uniref:Uncharacterized protein n=1 Tax=Melastoma candidum TaxID=119954 RepID=A0ACB9QXQ3_9MYRT|nr:hypothetical protein MLD38_019636 [Melastoma candidum]